MTAVQTAVTEAELADWLTTGIGPEIGNEYDTATQLLTVFDFKARDSASLNNQNQIASCITEAGPWFVSLTAEAAAQHLLVAFRVTRKPANYDRLFVDLPMPVVVSRHQCPFCHRFTRADLRQVQDHMTRCWQNPRLRTCKTCVHYQPQSTDFGHQCHPGYHCGCNDWDESCTHPEGPDDFQFPVLHCPLWQPKTEEARA
ncbi:hypothetical protein ACWEG1_05815 [Streptomyces bauhiniae]